MICPVCSRETPPEAVCCPFCTAMLDLSGMTVGESTGKTNSVVTSAPPAQHFSAPSTTVPSGIGFTPGTTLAGRYRIVTMLGRGGMGEVYRADDLKLSQSVALKFLPPALANDAGALARFLTEVRTARQITHPNVCRVYDIGEARGRTFLSMEYIDGEDLASLLRRVGRLPPDKALEIARELCAGVAAAHNAGVIHRDLKPANIMIDGRGHAHVTDFGLSGLAEEFQYGRSRAGTPAYMAPEQLAHGEVSIASDIFSLGLILYETFTGRRVFDGEKRETLIRLHEQSLPSFLESHTEGLDPLVERALFRCLSRDPNGRPGSAQELARVLPGGDPLAAALAAGETPSPEMVAAAGGEGALSLPAAWRMLGLTIAGLAVMLALTPWSMEFGVAPMEQAPEDLAARARTIVKKLGYSDPAADTATWFTRNSDFLSYRSKRIPSPQAWRTLRSAEESPQLFFYRQSPLPLIPEGASVAEDDPPMRIAGMIEMQLDTRGSLLNLWVVPPQLADSSAVQTIAPDWSALLAESSMDVAKLRPESPYWIPPVPYDAIAGWQAGDPQSPTHLTAAAFRGKPVCFEVAGPWQTPQGHTPTSQGTGANVARYLLVAAWMALLVIGLFMARRNRRVGRGDDKGALRLAESVLILEFAGSWLSAPHGASPIWEWSAVARASGNALFLAAFSWIMYMAIEPFVRARWPQILIGWSRLLSGRYRDPLVGRDVVAGTTAGVLTALIYCAGNALPAWIDVRGWSPASSDPLALAPGARFLAYLCFEAASAVGGALIITFVLLLALVVGRRPAIALALTWIVAVGTGLGKGENLLLDVAIAMVTGAIWVLVLNRYGILAAALQLFAFTVLFQSPLTVELSRWYAGRSLLVVALCLALAVYGFRASLGGKPAFGSSLLSDAR